MIIVNMSWSQFETACKQIAKQVPPDITDIYGIPRGGLVLAVRLSHLLNKPLIFDIGEISQNTLVCDDIADTGKRIQKLIAECAKLDLEGTGNWNFKIATLVYHPKSKIKPDIYVYEKGDQWCVFPWEAK